MKLVPLCFAVAVTACNNIAPNELSQNEKITSDAAEFCALVEGNYAYFAERSAHWSEACALAQQEAGKATDSAGRLAVLEQLIDALYDPHATLGANSATSPRLIPSGSDYKLVSTGGRVVVDGVRPGSGAARAGLQTGDALIAINGQPLREAAMIRIRTGHEHVSEARLEWAMNAMAAGYRGAPRSVTLRRNGERLSFNLGDPIPEWPGELVTAQMLDGNIGYIRLNNSLGDDGMVKAFDTALEMLKNARGWILDLRDTPGGGNTGVAEPIMGRFINEERPYQRIIPADGEAYNRTVSPRGPWMVTGPLVILVGHWTGSMGEGMAVGFDGMERGHVIGGQMAGLAGGTESFTLSQTGVSVHLPTYDLAHIDGTPRHEWLPPHKVLADNGDGPDLAMSAAITWLTASIVSEGETP